MEQPDLVNFGRLGPRGASAGCWRNIGHLGQQCFLGYQRVLGNERFMGNERFLGHQRILGNKRFLGHQHTGRRVGNSTGADVEGIFSSSAAPVLSNASLRLRLPGPGDSAVEPGKLEL